MMCELTNLKDADQYNWSIGVEIFNWISSNLEKDKIILEFGSGVGTKDLAKYWKIFSVEEDVAWVNKYHNKYIHAPIVDNWYDLKAIKNNMPVQADLILVDGPAYGKRIGFFDNISIVDPIKLNTKFIIFDDVERKDDLECYLKVADHLRNNVINKQIFTSRSRKQFAVIGLK